MEYSPGYLNVRSHAFELDIHEDARQYCDNARPEEPRFTPNLFTIGPARASPIGAESIQAILLAGPALGIAVYSATSIGIVLFLDVFGALFANLIQAK